MPDNDNKYEELRAAYNELYGHALRLYEICTEQNALLKSTPDSMKSQFRLGIICGISISAVVINILILAAKLMSLA